MSFTPTEHAYVGTERAYIPQGFTPYAPTPPDSRTILPAGDTVTVLSAWSRDYLPADAPILLYVRSHATGECTHVVAADLPLGVARAAFSGAGVESWHLAPGGMPVYRRVES